MSRPGNTATVIDLAAARERPAGQRTYKANGRRMGGHGNRASGPMRRATIDKLIDLLETTGRVTAADKACVAADAGMSVRQVNRWWNAELDRQTTALLDDRDPDEPAELAQLPRHLYRHNEPNRLQLTLDEVKFFARHTCIADAIAAVRATPGHRLAHYGTSTIYAAYANITAPVRAGARGGAKAQRKIEATYGLTGRDMVNESWSIDEYDLKLKAIWRGVEVEPKVLIVRERTTDVPLAWVVLPRSANGRDTGTVLATAAIGYTVPHPDRDGDDLRVAGVARYLVSDQGGPFIGLDGVDAARRLGITLNPTSSYAPQSNGDHEVMHQPLLRYFHDGPGSRRGWTDHTGRRLDHGAVPFEDVVDDVTTFLNHRLQAPFTSGPRKGFTRLQMYAQHLEDGNVHHGHVLTPEDEASVAPVIAERSYDPTRGVEWENRYFTSSALASAADPGERITLRMLLNPDVAYAYDRDERFIGIVKPREHADVDEVHNTHRDRHLRKVFIETNVAHPRAAAARDAATAAWDEAAEGLATAADHEAHPPTGAPSGADAAAQALGEALAADQDPDAHQPSARASEAASERTAHTAIQPTSRRRRKSADESTRYDDAAAEREADEDANALAALFLRGNRRRNPHPDHRFDTEPDPDAGPGPDRDTDPTPEES